MNDFIKFPNKKFQNLIIMGSKVILCNLDEE